MAKSKDVTIEGESDDYSDWKVQSALDALMRFHEIIEDPKMVSKVKKLAKQKKKEFRCVDDLIKHRNELATKGEGYDDE